MNNSMRNQGLYQRATGYRVSYLFKHEKIKQAVVVGVQDMHLGEACVAFIELKQNAHAAEDEIINFCRTGLASFKVPRKIIFVKDGL